MSGLFALTIFACGLALTGNVLSSRYDAPRQLIADSYRVEAESASYDCLVCESDEKIRIKGPKTPDGGAPHLVRESDGGWVPAECFNS